MPKLSRKKSLTAAISQKLPKEKSTDAATKKDGGKIKFDSQATTVPAEVKEAAFKLKDGEVSEPIAATNAQTYQTTYYVVKMTKNKAKGNDMKPYEKEIKKIAEEYKISRSNICFQVKVISDELKAANVKIKDDAFKNALAGYMQTESSSASSEKKESKSSDSKTSDTKTSDSEKATDSSSKTTESSSK